jgi:hypothetical protein
MAEHDAVERVVPGLMRVWAAIEQYLPIVV